MKAKGADSEQLLEVMVSWRAGAGIRCSPGPYQQTIKHLVGRRVCARVCV